MPLESVGQDIVAEVMNGKMTEWDRKYQNRMIPLGELFSPKNTQIKISLSLYFFNYKLFLDFHSSLVFSLGSMKIIFQIPSAWKSSLVRSASFTSASSNGRTNRRRSTIETRIGASRFSRWRKNVGTASEISIIFSKTTETDPKLQKDQSRRPRFIPPSVWDHLE